MSFLQNITCYFDGFQDLSISAIDSRLSVAYSRAELGESECKSKTRIFLQKLYLFIQIRATGKQSFDSSSKSYIKHRALCHQITGKQKEFLALPHLLILLRLQTEGFIHWIDSGTKNLQRNKCNL